MSGYERSGTTRRYWLALLGSAVVALGCNPSVRNFPDEAQDGSVTSPSPSSTNPDDDGGGTGPISSPDDDLSPADDDLAPDDDLGDDDLDDGGADDDAADDDLVVDEDASVGGDSDFDGGGEADDDLTDPELEDAGNPDAGAEPLACAVGTSRFCDGGAPGACARGEQSCDESGSWGACSAEPALEDSCDLGNDDNCNGTVNDGCDCVNGDEQSCAESNHQGTCAEGTQLCVDGEWGACSVSPAAADTCVPGNDDNCNGIVNELCSCEQDDTRSCADGGWFGPCAAGTQTCGADGAWGPCSIAAATYDSCAADADENCDGVPNAPLDPACDCVEGDGQCVAGNPSTARQVCTSAGDWGTATPCENVCTGAGLCGGVCAPPERQCNNNVPQVCTVAGQWQNETACGASTPCQGGLCQACPDGSYATGGTCAPWRTCPAGQYVSTAGSPTNDRVCTPCSAGTYSATTNALSCAPWSQCDAGIGLIQDAAGTASSDRTCRAFPSCSGLANNCGASGTESCCSSPLVAGGTFERWNSEYSPATISSFRLDKFETTVGRFRAFKSAWDGGWRPAAAAGKHTYLNSGNGLDNLAASPTYEPGWNKSWDANVDISNTGLACDATFATWTSTAGSNERRPINCLSWYAAHAFCIWDGGFLPSDAEWNYAAAGGGGTFGQRAYPWSDPSSSTTINATHASYWVDSTLECGGDGVNGCAVGDLILVGTKPAGSGRYGHADMAGNVAEWTLDFWNNSQAGSCTDCTNLPSDGTSRMSRGGSYDAPAGFLYTLFGFGVDPATPSDAYGVRCARAP